MKQLRSGLRFEDMLSDPLIQAVMAADGVDARKLDAILSEIAGTLASRPHSAASRRAGAGGCQRSAAVSSERFASTQVVLPAASTCFQNGAHVFR